MHTLECFGCAEITTWLGKRRRRILLLRLDGASFNPLRHTNVFVDFLLAFLGCRYCWGSSVLVFQVCGFALGFSEDAYLPKRIYFWCRSWLLVLGVQVCLTVCHKYVFIWNCTFSEMVLTMCHKYVFIWNCTFYEMVLKSGIDFIMKMPVILFVCLFFGTFPFPCLKKFLHISFHLIEHSKRTPSEVIKFVFNPQVTLTNWPVQSQDQMYLCCAFSHWLISTPSNLTSHFACTEIEMYLSILKAFLNVS